MFWKSGIIEQPLVFEQAHWHGGETNCCSSTSLVICTIGMVFNVVFIGGCPECS